MGFVSSLEQVQMIAMLTDRQKSIFYKTLE